MGNAPHELPKPPDPSRIDHRIVLDNVSWSQYEALLTSRGERAGVRMTYLKGRLEIMSPSLDHESIKTIIARLLEAWAEENDVELLGYGSWTVKSEPEERGLEPDECYVVGVREANAPDLAIEVVWTSGLLDKMEVYRGLGVGEVWVWRDGRVEVSVLEDGQYARATKSKLFPRLDLDRLVSFVGRKDQTSAVREYRQSLRSAAPK